MGEFKNFAIILFLIGATLAQEEDSSTKLCNNEEGKVFFAKLNACSDLARQNLLLNILDSSIYKTSCEILAARVNMIICFGGAMFI